MTKEELIARLGKFEWKDVEFKKAQRGVPEDSYETVSSFSNTSGGYLVFGIKDTHGDFEVVGVIEVDKVQNDFLSCLRAGSKLNRAILVQEDAIEHEGKTLLIFYIPEAPRREKPVYLNGDIRISFIRRGGGDERCNKAEIERFLRDAAEGSYDIEMLRDIDSEEFFDPDSVAWYRGLLQQMQGGRYAELSDLEFLNEWGFVVEWAMLCYPLGRPCCFSAKDAMCAKFSLAESLIIKGLIRPSINGPLRNGGTTV